MYPTSVKISFWAYLLVWAFAYSSTYPLYNFLWTCNLSLILVGVALVLESRLLLSAQLITSLLANLLWMADFLGILLLGIHFTGSTQYMFDENYSLGIRALSLVNHLAITPLLGFFIWRHGYVPSALPLATATAAIACVLAYGFSNPEFPVNWVFGPFGQEQHLLPPLLYLALYILAFFLICLWPPHWLARRFWYNPAGPAQRSEN